MRRLRTRLHLAWRRDFEPAGLTPMFLLNFTWPQLFFALGIIGAGVITLYLRKQSHSRRKVATLRFWKAGINSQDVRKRRKIQELSSLLLQVLSVALLLLALAQLRMGTPDQPGRNHVLLLDTSSSMAQPGPMDYARAAAKKYLRALPACDRVMLVRAD